MCLKTRSRKIELLGIVLQSAEKKRCPSIRVRCYDAPAMEAFTRTNSPAS
jgi:hypothetical protein